MLSDMLYCVFRSKLPPIPFEGLPLFYLNILKSIFDADGSFQPERLAWIFLIESPSISIRNEL